MRDYDGTNDNIEFGSDASLDNNALAISIACWVDPDVINATQALATKGDTAWYFRLQTSGGQLALRFFRVFGAGASHTTATGQAPANTRTHVAATHDGTTAAPTIYVNGAVVGGTGWGTPTGTAVDDSANNMRTGELLAGTLDYNGRIGCLLYLKGTVLTAEDINRARWWGRCCGALTLYHPFWTDKLANEGVATADGTATGTTVVSGAVLNTWRPGFACMGSGVGF